MTAPDGRRYKMLFAPLIIDLDGRINLNYAGSLTSRSNQGWGKWEMDLTQVVFHHDRNDRRLSGQHAAGRTTRAYGAAGSLPNGTPLLGPIGTWYSPTDYLGTGTPLQLPTASATAPVYSFPTFTGYGNTTALANNHPSRYNYFKPAGTNRFFPTSNMERCCAAATRAPRA